ncbi:MAG: metal ABC transporter substrate-binding protein [Eubacteriales bacterium]
MKKYALLLMGAFMALSFATGCSNTAAVEESSTTSEVVTEVEETVAEVETLKVVTTIFPEYDWTREILGENLANTELIMLLDNGVDLHSYQATADDIITIADCDLFIYVGGESDSWVDDALQNATNPDMIVINLMEVLGDSVKVEESVVGMQVTEHDHDEEATTTEEEHDHDEEATTTEEEHDHDEEATTTEEDHDHDEEATTTEEEHDHEEESGIVTEAYEHGHDDEHVWLSLANAEIICNTIASELTALDPDNAQMYSDNLTTYLSSLQVLDTQYEEAVSQAAGNTILVADRFPYRYLVDDYTIEYYAAFSGCSAETEASFETIAFLATKLDELGLSTVITTESSDNKIADTVIASTINQDQAILSLNSMQAITSQDVAAGVTYLSIMEDNLVVLIEALQ